MAAEGMQMKLILLLILLASMALAGSPANITGTWKLQFAGPRERGPKTVGSIILDLSVDGDNVTGLAHIGSWPGEAPIADGKIDGDRITFTATGHLDSTTGIPTCKFEVTVHGAEMRLTMTAVKNPGGPLPQGVSFEYAGKKKLE
jgi:hypothetical protein